MFEVDNTMGLIRPVLLNNYFTEEKELTFVNGSCIVEVDLKDEVYNVSFRDKGYGKCLVTSESLNLYWLFGFLAANDLVSRDFKL